MLLVALVVTLCGATSRAQDRHEAVVVLTLEGNWSEKLADEVRADLDASLRERGLGLVEPEQVASQLRPMALVRLDAPSREARQARVEVRDLVHETEAQRVIELSHHPDDTWSFVIAVSIDELLRATWTDLAVSRPSLEPENEAPAQTPSEAPQRLAKQRPLAWGAGPALEMYTAGARLLGGDARVALRFDRRLSVDVALGGRTLWPMAFEAGSVTARALALEVGASAGLLPRHEPVGLDLVVGVRALRIGWRGRPEEGFFGREERTQALVVRAGVRSTIPVGRDFYLGLLVTAGTPLLGSVAADDEGNEMGVGGLELGTRLELGWQ